MVHTAIYSITISIVSRVHSLHQLSGSNQLVLPFSIFYPYLYTHESDLMILSRRLDNHMRRSPCVLGIIFHSTSAIAPITTGPPPQAPCLPTSRCSPEPSSSLSAASPHPRASPLPPAPAPSTHPPSGPPSPPRNLHPPSALRPSRHVSMA